MEFLTQMINGLSTGGMYALVAIGYTMVYGIAKMINFAHGEIIMVGAYLAYTTTSIVQAPIYISVIVSIVCCAILGVITEKVAYKPLRNSGSLAVLITAIGVSYLLQNLFLILLLIIFSCVQTISPIQQKADFFVYKYGFICPWIECLKRNDLGAVNIFQTVLSDSNLGILW